MTDRLDRDIESLRRAMEEAAGTGDYEKAAILRDRISLLRSAPEGPSSADFDPTGLVRQQPGAMGLGTSRQRVTPPPGWTPPDKPDPMTSGRSRRGRKAKAGR
ncbi:UvrB/UvrC motif-containing protein [Sphingobium sp. AN558]|uniref:UvrB/UvrC motif-containing protein n=1 Tax=Sphingobium sp. AN558 TaxID=3133442 RepID=UPI0030C5AA00